MHFDQQLSNDDDTVRLRLPSVTEVTLEVVVTTLERAHACPRARAYKAKAESFRRAVARWPVCRPSEQQREALSDLVFSLHDEVAESVRHGSLSLAAARDDDRCEDDR